MTVNPLYFKAALWHTSQGGGAEKGPGGAFFGGTAEEVPRVSVNKLPKDCTDGLPIRVPQK